MNNRGDWRFSWYKNDRKTLLGKNILNYTLAIYLIFNIGYIHGKTIWKLQVKRGTEVIKSARK